jgi:hypothetical protein
MVTPRRGPSPLHAPSRSGLLAKIESAGSFLEHPLAKEQLPSSGDEFLLPDVEGHLVLIERSAGGLDLSASSGCCPPPRTT